MSFIYRFTTSSYTVLYSFVFYLVNIYMKFVSAIDTVRSSASMSGVARLQITKEDLFYTGPVPPLELMDPMSGGGMGAMETQRKQQLRLIQFSLHPIRFALTR